MTVNLNAITCFFCKKTPNQLTEENKVTLKAFKALERCSECRDAWYCSDIHQRQHWREHRRVCTKYIFSERSYVYYSFLEQLKDEEMTRLYALKEDKKRFYFLANYVSYVKQITIYVPKKNGIDQQMINKIKELAKARKLKFICREQLTPISEFNGSSDELTLSDLEPPTF